jgi:hypothetical protein
VLTTGYSFLWLQAIMQKKRKNNKIENFFLINSSAYILYDGTSQLI